MNTFFVPGCRRGGRLYAAIGLLIIAIKLPPRPTALAITARRLVTLTKCTEGTVEIDLTVTHGLAVTAE